MISSSSSGARLLGDKVPGKIRIHVFGAESGCGPERSETLKTPGNIPDLLLQFPLRGLLRGLSGIYPARRSLQQVFAYRVPILPNEQRVCPIDRWAELPRRRRVRLLHASVCLPLGSSTSSTCSWTIRPSYTSRRPIVRSGCTSPSMSLTARHTSCDDEPPTAASTSSRRPRAGRPARSWRYRDSS